jgi:hypothetical protein
LTDEFGTRVQNLDATLQKWDADLNAWVTLDWQPLAQDLTNLEYGTDFEYFANAGVFGNSAVYSSLHYSGGKPKTWASAILLEDNFAGNNDPATNVIRSNFSGNDAVLSDDGSYQIVISGTLKGNSGSASAPFVVGSSILQIGGCECP